MATVPPQETRQQAVASAAQTVFTYQFLILREEDLSVYKRPNSQEPSDISDKLTLNVDYTVTGVGNETGGTFILTVPADAGDIVTWERDTIIERETDFDVAGPLTGAALNFEFDRLVMIGQELDTRMDQQMLTYQTSNALSANRIENILPQLTPNSDGKISIWSRGAGGGITSLIIDSTDDVNTLRTELASQADGGDGALLVGYYDSSTSSGKTTHAKLDEISISLAGYADNTSHTSCGAQYIGYNPNANPTNVRDELDKVGNSRVVPISATLAGAAYNGDTGSDIFAFTAYDEGATYKVKFNAANPGGGVTLNLNGIGAKPLTESDGRQLDASFIGANDSALVYYSATADEFRIFSITSGSSTSGAHQALAWVYFTGAVSPVIQKSYNVSSVTRSAMGVYNVTFSKTMDSVNYVVVASGDAPASTGASFAQQIHTRTTTSVVLEYYEFYSGSWQPQDTTGASLVIFGALA